MKIHHHHHPPPLLPHHQPPSSATTFLQISPTTFIIINTSQRKETKTKTLKIPTFKSKRNLWEIPSSVTLCSLQYAWLQFPLFFLDNFYFCSRGEREREKESLKREININLLFSVSYKSVKAYYLNYVNLFGYIPYTNTCKSVSSFWRSLVSFSCLYKTLEQMRKAQFP